MKSIFNYYLKFWGFIILSVIIITLFTVMIKTIGASPIFHLRSKFSKPRVDNPRFVNPCPRTCPIWSSESQAVL